ncbi:ATP-binding protein [Streptomyces sp. NPDC005202]|uniref:ATP-binding protein n=1 Tax=Streptomyces sp. NPDC005202 TaxID=3157021 RepID=UPI00339E28C0
MDDPRRRDRDGGAAAQRVGDERVPPRQSLTGREIRARCVLEDGSLRIAVTDANEALPQPRRPSPDDESGGRGLTLVAALADEWGAEPRACGIGKTVWFLLAVKP